MAHIEVSEKVAKEFERLKSELKGIYNGQELPNDQIMEAMIGGFFDSLAYMKKESEGHKGHHHHGDDECCGGSDDCENKKDGECCGGHHH